VATNAVAVPLCYGLLARYYGLLASGKRAENVARARELLLTPPPVIPIDAIKAINSNPETRTEKQLAGSPTAKARLPLLRRSDDHHRSTCCSRSLRRRFGGPPEPSGAVPQNHRSPAVFIVGKRAYLAGSHSSEKHPRCEYLRMHPTLAGYRIGPESLGAAWGLQPPISNCSLVRFSPVDRPRPAWRTQTTFWRIKARPAKNSTLNVRPFGAVFFLPCKFMSDRLMLAIFIASLLMTASVVIMLLLL
jgi:hypothetical protein